MGAVAFSKDPGVFDLLGSSLSCDTTVLTPPNKHLCLRVASRTSGRPVLASEEMRAPGRNYVLPRQIPLKPGSPWKFLQLTPEGIQRGCDLPTSNPRKQRVRRYFKVLQQTPRKASSEVSSPASQEIP